MNTKNFEELIMSLIKLADGKSAVINDETPLMMLIRHKMEKEALALIDTGKSQPEFMDKYKRTALWYAIYHELEKVALKLISIGKIELYQPICKNITPLMKACQRKTLEKVALALIATGKSKPDAVSYSKDTPLIYACFYQMETVALALLKTGQSNYQQKDNAGYDALHYAKHYNLTKVVEKIESMMKPATASQTPIPTQKDFENLSLALLEFINSKTDEKTPLIYFIKNNKSNVAMTLVATGQCQFEKTTIYGNTALLLACQGGLYDLALALIATGKSLPENVNTDGDTALLYTCQVTNHENIALALLETGKSNYQHTTRNGYDALYYAKNYNMTKVVKKIESLMNQTSTALTLTSTSSTQNSSTLKCLDCKKDLDKIGYVIVPCGHSQFHLDCLSDMRYCPVCKQAVLRILELK